MILITHLFFHMVNFKEGLSSIRIDHSCIQHMVVSCGHESLSMCIVNKNCFISQCVGKSKNQPWRYVTVFWKTDHLDTTTEIHLLPVRDRHTHALSRNTKH